MFAGEAEVRAEGLGDPKGAALRCEIARKVLVRLLEEDSSRRTRHLCGAAHVALWHPIRSLELGGVRNGPSVF